MKSAEYLNTKLFFKQCTLSFQTPYICAVAVRTEYYNRFRPYTTDTNYMFYEQYCTITHFVPHKQTWDICYAWTVPVRNWLADRCVPYLYNKLDHCVPYLYNKRGAWNMGSACGKLFILLTQWHRQCLFLPCGFQNSLKWLCATTGTLPRRTLLGAYLHK